MSCCQCQQKGCDNMAKDMKGKTLPKGITQRPDGRYMGRFQYEGENYCLYDLDLDKLQNAMDDMRYELRYGIYEKEQKITVKSWYKTWMEEYKVNTVKKGTIKVYKQTFSKYIEPEIGKKKIKDIRPEHIQRLYNKLSLKIRLSTLNSVAEVLSGMFRQAEKNGIIKKNPVALATQPREKQKKERRVLSAEEQKTFLKYAKGQPSGDLFEVALSTGMRAGELCGLEWSDLDFSKGIIHVTGTLVYFEGNYFKDTPKTVTSRRDIPMLDNVCKILKERRKEQIEQRFLMGELWQPLEGLENLVFTHENGRHICQRTLSDRTNKIVRMIQKEHPEFERITPHTLRHSFATRCIEQGVPPQVLKTILGHSKLSMTMDLYSHVLPDTKAEELKKIVGLFQ